VSSGHCELHLDAQELRMEIRLFRETDASALAAIFFSSVREIGGRYYTAEQVAAWAPRLPDASFFHRRASDGRTLLVAISEKGQPIAYGDLEPDGHIDHLYCSPEAAGSGVASQLYDGLERVARNAGIGMSYVEASEPAKRFFHKQGFELTDRNDLQLNGVEIHNYRMRKTLP
jgi:putative acetyltransferase